MKTFLKSIISLLPVASIILLFSAVYASYTDDLIMNNVIKSAAFMSDNEEPDIIQIYDPEQFNSLYPGDVVSDIIYMKNPARCDSWVYISVRIPHIQNSISDEGYDVIKPVYNEGEWIEIKYIKGSNNRKYSDHIYRLKNPMKANEQESSVCISSFYISEDNDKNIFKESIIINGYIIQYKNIDSSEADKIAIEHFNLE